MVFDMTDVVDLSTAEGAFATLLDARDKPRAAAADLVRALKTKTRNRGNQSHEIEIVQADAWLAICSLSKSLDTDYETSPEVGLAQSVARKSGEIFWPEVLLR